MSYSFHEDESLMVRVENLCITAPTYHHFENTQHARKRILHNVSFDLYRGERIAIIGSSGSGKTTLLKSIAGVIPHALDVSGCVHVKQDELAYIMQEPKAALNPLRNIGVMFSVLRHSRRHALDNNRERCPAKARINQDMYAAFTSMNLTQHSEASDGHTRIQALLAKHRSHISGGMAQRVMVALAIAAGSRWALADEVSSALDEVHERKTIELLLSTMKSILFVTHRMNIVRDYCTKVLVLKSGTVHFFGKVEALLRAQHYDETIGMFMEEGGGQTQEHKSISVPATTESKQGEVVLRCEALSFSYARRSLFRCTPNDLHNLVLRDITLYIRKGEVVFVHGQTGCGKSTLAHVCAGHIRPSLGLVSIGGMPMPYGTTRAMRLFRRSVQLISQVPSLSFNPLRRVLHSLMDAHATMSKKEKKDSEDYMRHLCEIMHISQALVMRFPHQLSGGQLQRLAIIRALLSHPKILILDEPVSHLDPHIRLQVLELIRTVQAETNITLMVISHLKEVFTFIRRTYPHCACYTLEGGTMLSE